MAPHTPHTSAEDDSLPCKELDGQCHFFQTFLRQKWWVGHHQVKIALLQVARQLERLPVVIVDEVVAVDLKALVVLKQDSVVGRGLDLEQSGVEGRAGQAGYPTGNSIGAETIREN